jgi:hypothetical protein
VVSKIFEAGAVKIVKHTMRPIGGHRRPRSSCLPHVDTGLTVSIFGKLPENPCLPVSGTLCDSSCISLMVRNRRPFSLNFIFGNRKKSQGAKTGENGGWGMTAILFFNSVKFNADDALLLLVSCQDPGHKFSCDMVYAQFCQNPLACPITNYHLLSNVVNGPTSILTEELLNSCNAFRSCAACGSPCVFVIVN